MSLNRLDYPDDESWEAAIKSLDKKPMKHENKWPKKVADFPSGELLAILMPKSTHVPGDERSRTNPGHGYPAHTEQSWEIQLFPNEEEWKAEIVRLMSAEGFMRKQFKAFRMIPPEVTTRITVE